MRVKNFEMRGALEVNLFGFSITGPTVQIEGTYLLLEQGGHANYPCVIKFEDPSKFLRDAFNSLQS